jgi:phage terminase large subunit-like protein
VETQTSLQVRLHPVQIAFRRSRALYRAFVGGRGAGKSYVGAFDMLRRMRVGGTYLVGSPTGILMGDTTYPTFKDIATGLRVWGGVKLTPYPTATILLTTAAGKTGTAAVRFRTAEDPERMRGPNLSGVWLDEASLMDEAVYGVCIPALRESGRQGWLSATFTPKGPTHWTYEVFNTGRDDTALFRARTGENPFNPPGFEATIRRQYGDTQFARQELGGEFVAIEGAEFPAEWFDWPGFWFDDWPADLTHKVVYLDPSKGRDAKQGDWQALVSAALDRENTIYLDADLNREPPPEMIARVVRHVRAWGPVASVGLEDNGTMGFIGPEIERQTRQAGVLIPWHLVTNREPKLFRIRGLGGYLSRRQIRVRNTPGGRLLRAQLGDVPFGEFDDGPDAAAGAVRMLERLTVG